MSTAPLLLWFRKDLRLADNHALAAAVETGRPVIPVYIREPGHDGSGPLGGAQAWFLHHSLAALDKALKHAGSRLICRSGKAGDALFALIEETGADTIHWNRRYDPAGMQHDSALKTDLKKNGLTVESFAGHLMHEPSKLKTKSGTPYKVYTPFWRALDADYDPPEPVSAPDKIKHPHKWPDSETRTDWALLPTKPDWAAEFSDLWTPGEGGAHKRLERFLDEGLDRYETGRDFPARDVTSGLSPHLALGEISPASIWHATRNLDHDLRDAVVKFRKELAWRDFCYHLLYHFPKLDRDNWNDKFDDFPWETNSKAFKAWTKGATGYPIVDAGMRQLWRHGIMHNRVRMIAASFLIKDLMIDWRRGERWFRDTLVDADPASNAANWQWVAGSGADASPFFRIFNPVLQGEKFDPDGAYIREFVPELKDLEKRYIHKPFEAPADVLKKAGVELGKHYPKPIVDHKQARDTALGAYKKLSG
ncbi:cryptochrome/photolyase family protein [Rhizobium halophytocola]|uniref:Deoxyribodipyrimidine photo-lyase n=1 Tax=Rhizobium halophytocola TaxID=735519 RepID=A0ABS4DW09_9HYPH|nr:deoxyribodipyrimidine photo-lyase [Rhizobium halophytocola]MBP1849829.1 deoxyribodipyrimidine photo-lyase [Rhizobium halophytocola]